MPVPGHLADHTETELAGVAAGLLASGPGDLYFLRSSPKPDTLRQILARGVKIFVATTQVKNADGSEYPTLLVRSPEDAFISVCRHLAGKYGAKRIALTGSVGKTTTKEMLRTVCQEAFNTLYSKGNQNGLAQVGRWVQKQTPETQVYIQETGAARPGMVGAAAEILRPHAFIITNVGLNHVGAYGGYQENILADKLSLDLHLPPDGVAFVNWDDPLLKEADLLSECIYYSVSDPEADYYATGLEVGEATLTFTVVEKSTGTREPVLVNAFGAHNVGNAVVTFAVGRWLGMSADQIRAGLAKYRAEGLRQNLIEVGQNRLLIDCYNASEKSAASIAEALATISPGPQGKRILVFADIDDKLGEKTEAVHRRVGKQLAEAAVDQIVLFGEHVRWVADELKGNDRFAFHTAKRSELHEYLERVVRPGDVVGFKGGQQMALAITVDALFGTGLAVLDGDTLQRRGKKFTEADLTYRSIHEYGAVLWNIPEKYPSLDLRVPANAGGLPVYMIGRLAGSGRPLRSAHIPAPIRTVAVSAFFNCRHLEEVHLPQTLRVIERSAFNNCRSLTQVNIPNSVTTIGDRAFYRCPQLRQVIIPSSVTSLGEDIFRLSPNVTVTGTRGSAAEAYCELRKIPFQSIE